MDVTALVDAELKKQGPIDLVSLRLDWEGLAVVGVFACLLCLFASFACFSMQVVDACF